MNECTRSLTSSHHPMDTQSTPPHDHPQPDNTRTHVNVSPPPYHHHPTTVPVPTTTDINVRVTVVTVVSTRNNSRLGVWRHGCNYGRYHRTSPGTYSDHLPPISQHLHPSTHHPARVGPSSPTTPHPVVPTPPFQVVVHVRSFSHHPHRRPDHIRRFDVLSPVSTPPTSIRQRSLRVPRETVSDSRGPFVGPTHRLRRDIGLILGSSPVVCLLTSLA